MAIKHQHSLLLSLHRFMNISLSKGIARQEVHKTLFTCVASKSSKKKFLNKTVFFFHLPHIKKLKPHAHHSSGLCRVFLKQYNNKHWLGNIDGCLQNKCQCYLLELTIIFSLMFLSLFSFHQLFHQHIKL